MDAAGDDGLVLRRVVYALREAIEGSELPLDLEETAQGRVERHALLRHLDDYVLPRLDSLDAPLLAVVGGSTGSGKSTLVNSIIGAEVSASGVLRPTTTIPVLIHHPEDASWFATLRILPHLSRVTGRPDDRDQPGTVRLVESAALEPGLALLDAPDIDSVVAANRSLAGQLLQAADMWLFVTTAARYADAVPWVLLREASDRGTAVAIVLDRVPPEDIPEVRGHLVEMLREQGMGTSPVFTIPETTLTSDGLLPVDALGRLAQWLEALASDQRARTIIVSHTLKGALSSLPARTETVAVAVRAQHEAARELVAVVDRAYDSARDDVADGITDGSLLRGEVLARWQEYVGTGEFFRQMESKVSRLRDRLTATLKGAPMPADEVDQALQSGVADLIRARADSAVAEIARTWRGMPGGTSALTSAPALATSDGTLPPRVERLVRDWQGDLLEMIRAEGSDRRTNARVAAFGLNGIALFLMLVAFASTGGLVGAEIGIATGTSVLAQRVLEAIFGDQSVREMSKKARMQLMERVEALLDEERARYRDGLGPMLVGSETAESLQLAAQRVTEAIDNPVRAEVEA